MSAPSPALLIGPIPIYFIRLPDDDREPTKMIFATMIQESNHRFLRGAWDPDTWDQWAAHPFFNRPIHLLGTPAFEDPGITLRIAALVPAREMPRSTWPVVKGEEWKGPRRPGRDERFPLELGVLVRYRHRMCHTNLLAEAGCLLRSALTAGTVEPYEQGLG